jgi:hypothetical protein
MLEHNVQELWRALSNREDPIGAPLRRRHVRSLQRGKALPRPPAPTLRKVSLPARQAHGEAPRPPPPWPPLTRHGTIALVAPPLHTRRPPCGRVDFHVASSSERKATAATRHLPSNMQARRHKVPLASARPHSQSRQPSSVRGECHCQKDAVAPGFSKQVSTRRRSEGSNHKKQARGTATRCPGNTCCIPGDSNHILR